MASTSNNALSSTSTREWRFDVFVSFCSRDTGNAFAGHLFEALRQLGIKSNFKKEEGDDDQKLIKASIQESRSFVVVFSKHYASSKSCLMELAEIMDTRKPTMRSVLPVFYHMNPSHVRNPTENFKVDFDEHEKQTTAEEITRWKDAMTKIGNLSGRVIIEAPNNHHTDHQPSNSNVNEAKEIKKISGQIFRSLLPKLIASNQNLVGITSELDHISKLLDMKNDKAVQFVGIVGMGGIGKTTLAQVVYRQIVDDYEGSCFLRISRSNKTAASLQSQLLNATVLSDKDYSITEEDDGAEKIPQQLRKRKVLLVLDGVLDDHQLTMLAGRPDWFGPGSRIIITTRFQSLLHEKYGNGIAIHEMKPLDGDAAFQLFCMHAFGTDNHDKNMDLVEKIVEHARGLPLALTVLGSSLYRRHIDVWKETLENLRHVSDKGIIDVLRLSYDALDSVSDAPKIFLDIACFFKGMKKERVIEILESFGYGDVDGDIELLIKRCLILVVDGKVSMHDLIQDMGQEVVYSESQTQVGTQSRIWLHQDLQKVVRLQDGLKSTQGIVLHLDEEKELKLEAESFKYMTDLRILEINNVQLLDEHGFKNLSNQLRILNWPGFPLKCLPTNFRSRFLFELFMPGSCLQKLWVGKKKFEKLKVIDLSKSDNLVVTPDLTDVQNLEGLILRECTKLKEIHPSVTKLKHLILLDLKDCISLKTFSSKLNCAKLKTFILSGCSSLESFPEIEEEKMEELAELYLDGTAIDQLHPSIGHLVGLVLLSLRKCERLLNLPSEIGRLKSLATLILHGCSRLEQIELSSENAECLKELDISYTSVTQPQLVVHYLKNLKVLHCQGLTHDIWHSLIGCSSGLESLTELNLSHCNLEDGDIPKDLHLFPSLEVLDLSGNHFVSLSDDLSQLTRLKKLYLNNCSLLQKLPMLPASFRLVEGKDCFSISKYYYNRELHIPSEELGVQTVRFPISDEYQNLQVVEGLDIHSTENRMSKQRLLEMYASDQELYHISSEMDGIFELFDHKEEGTWTEFYYNAHATDDDKKIYAISLVASVEILKLPALGTKISCDFLVQMKTDEYPPKHLLKLERKCELLSRTRVWVLYMPIHVLSKGLINQNSCSIKVSITSKNPDVKVEKCGLSILFYNNIAEFMGKMLGKFFHNRSSFVRITKDRDHLSEGRCIELEDPHEHSSIPSFHSDKYSSLEPLLRRTFEEVKHFAPFFVFPQQEISRWWFKHQQEQPTLTIKVPLALHDEKNWMGLALFVILAVDESVNSDQTSYTFNYEIDGDAYQLGESKYIPIPKFLLDDSHQVCIIFHPRAAFPYLLNECDHFHVNFIPHPKVHVVLCGARLVYQQNVEGLLQTIVDCVHRSPEDLHDFFYRRIVESFLITLKSLHTSFDSSQVHCVDPSLYTEATPSSLQDPFKCKFDRILYGHEIPNLFVHWAEENTVEISLPQHLYKDKTWMGFLVYSLVFVNKPTSSLNLKPGSLKLVDLICKFQVDSDPIEPEHFYITSEDSFVKNESQLFIWLFYVPRSEFNVVWRHCAHFGASLYTNRPELLSVLQCGLHLVSVKDKIWIEKYIK